ARQDSATARRSRAVAQRRPYSVESPQSTAHGAKGPTQSGAHTAAIKPMANAKETDRPNVLQADVIFRVARA
ncbi:hypothetical protein, partial [Paraburkholderia sabiae]|uniref:hypothetical protein n=1 Tax=Paraburkholderia sabiae TaxID=273251 RepID=UPI003F490A41